MTVKHHSASSLEKYDKCPLLYKHHYIEEWEIPQAESATFGVVLHDAVAHRLVRYDYEPDWFALYAEHGLPQDCQDLVQLTTEYYETWLKHQAFRDYPVAVEVEKEIMHEKYGKIVGKIDAIYSMDDSDGLLIVDHKFMLNTEKRKDNLQMAIYSILEPQATEFEYEKIGLDEFAIQRVKSLDGAFKKIDKIVTGINNQEFGATPAQWFIKYCPYLERCGLCIGGIR
jgi:hypothetical protein